MEWKTIKVEGKNRPKGRWGHSCCVVDTDLYLFGGFQFSYFSDLWRYSYKELAWTRLQATGDRPSPRSNATICYDSKQKQLILFGGGGPSKMRYNEVHTLELNSMEWRLSSTRAGEQAPWERTYHCAEFKHPYLVIFGGQGLTDLADLWIYHIVDSKWKQMRLEGGPSPRKFHSSCLIGNTMFVYGGCSGNYQCQKDLYSLDLSQLYENGKSFTANWNKVDLIGDEIEARWGHNMVTYRQQILIYGGRASDDKSELFSISSTTGQVRRIETIHKQAKRRKANGGMIGSCFVLFGGFSGRYFDDFYFLNLDQIIKKNGKKLQGDVRVSEINTLFWQKCLVEVESCLQSKNFLSLNGVSIFQVDKGLIRRSSLFLRNLLKWDKASVNLMSIEIAWADVLAFRVVLAFLHTERLIVPTPASINFLHQIGKISTYLCIEQLSRLCEEEMISIISETNRIYLQMIAEDLGFQQLRDECARLQVEQITSQNLQLLTPGQEKELSCIALEHYVECKFYWAHRLRAGDTIVNFKPPKTNFDLFSDLSVLRQFDLNLGDLQCPGLT